MRQCSQQEEVSVRIRVDSTIVRCEPAQSVVVEIPDAETADGLLFQTVERNNVYTVEVLTVTALEDDDEG